MSGGSLRLITVANLTCDALQLSPQWHFDSAPDPGAIVALWRQGCRKALSRSLRYCRPNHGMPRNRRLALLAFGAASHAIADFYAHTNWIELYLQECSPDSIPLAPLSTLECDVSQFPPRLQSGYFHLRHGIYGCPRVDGVYCPPPGFLYAHAQLAKDFSNQGHGADPIAAGSLTTHFEVAVRLAADATLQAWQNLSQLLLETYGPVTRAILAYLVREEAA